jgi:hypothetical protein
MSGTDGETVVLQVWPAPSQAVDRPRRYGRVYGRRTPQGSRRRVELLPEGFARPGLPKRLKRWRVGRAASGATRGADP